MESCSAEPLEDEDEDEDEAELASDSSSDMFDFILLKKDMQRWQWLPNNAEADFCSQLENTEKRFY